MPYTSPLYASKSHECVRVQLLALTTVFTHFQVTTLQLRVFHQVVISGERKQSVDPAYRQGYRTGSLVDYPITKRHYTK